MTEWVKYTGSPEQIEKIRNAKNGVIIKHHNGEICPAIFTEESELLDHFDDRSKYQPSEYLICNPHPNSDMICLQARTGQPVWIKGVFCADDVRHYDIVNIDNDGCAIYKTTKPNWNLPYNPQYSFTPFED